MSLTWRQVLRGSYFDVRRPDEVHPAELMLHVRVSRRAPAAGGPAAELRGQLTLDGMLAERPVTGVLLSQLWPRPRLSCELQVAASDGGRPLTLRVGLQPRLLRPLRSVTRMWGSLEDDGETIALVHLRYDVRRDLIESLHSLRVVGQV